MKIGVKYCGGCNSRYDRAREVNKLIKQFPQHTFVYDTQNPGVCDVWLIVCGCMTSCATAEDLVALKKIFTLRIPRDFVAVVAFLKQGDTEEKPREKRVLQIGNSASMTKTFTAEDIIAFAKVTGDFGKIHLDKEFAAKYGFGRPIVHGVLTGSLISSVMGMQLPGDGTILMDEDIRFTAPVYAGDTVTATVVLKGVKEMKRFYVGELYGTCTNQEGTIVAEGTCHQMMMMNLFSISSTLEETEKNTKE